MQETKLLEAMAELKIAEYICTYVWPARIKHPFFEQFKRSTDTLMYQARQWQQMRKFMAPYSYEQLLAMEVKAQDAAEEMLETLAKKADTPDSETTVSHIKNFTASFKDKRQAMQANQLPDMVQVEIKRVALESVEPD